MILNNIGGGVHTFEKRAHILKRGGFSSIKHFNIIFILLGVHTFQKGLKSNNYISYNYLICSKQNLIPTINVLPSLFYV